jgi:hypothetical protein
MTGRVRETVASIAQYVMLGGFAAVAAGISAQGLTGFARQNMGLRGVWPYLLFLSLDGAAGVCAVLLTRRAARAESALAPRLAVWGLVSASSTFNWTHAPHHPGAPEAFGLMPVIAAVLFEFTLHEQRHRAGRTDRRLTALRWLHPAECIRVQLRLAADSGLSADVATQCVRVTRAADRLYALRRALHTRHPTVKPSAVTAWRIRIRIAERRAHAALTHAGFADPAIAADVLRQVQVLILAPELAWLDYTTADAAHAAIAGMIGLRLPAIPPSIAQPSPQSPGSYGNASHDATQSGALASPDTDAATGQDDIQGDHLIAAATRILTEANQRGERLSQKTLGDILRREGHRVANHTLRDLMTAATSAPSSPTGNAPPPAKPPGAVDGHPGNGNHPASPAPPRRGGQDVPDPPGT